jgi:hypothetical protein
VAPAAPTIGLVAGTLSTYAGGYYYVGTYGNSISGHESSPSPLSTCTGNFAAKNPKITWVASPDPQVDTYNIYRTTDGGASTPSEMGFVATVPVGTLTYTDSIPDGSLSAVFSRLLPNDRAVDECIVAPADPGHCQRARPVHPGKN